MTTEPDGLVEKLLREYSERTNGPSHWTSASSADWKRRAADALSAAQRMTDAAEMLWVVLANVSGGDWTKQSSEWQEAAARWRDNYFAALLSERSPQQKKAEASQRYSRPSPPAESGASPLSRGTATVFSDYWQCAACGSVLFSPTTGRADGVPCWKCSNVPLIIGEKQPAAWVPVVKPFSRSAYAVWCEIRKGLVGRLSDHELAAADIAFARVTAGEAPPASHVVAEEPSRNPSSEDAKRSPTAPTETRGIE